MQIDESAGREEKDVTSRIKLELKTPLETVFMWLSFCSLFLLVIGFIGYMEDGWTSKVMVMVYLGVISVVFFGSLYFNTDNFYILDMERRELLYHFKFFFLRKITVAARFDDINAVTVSGSYHKTKHDQWYSYQTVYVNGDGKVFPLSDPAREAIGKQRDLASQIAELTGARYVENPPQTFASECRSGSKYSFRHHRCSWLDSMKETAMVIVGVFGFIALVATINLHSEQILNIIKSIFK